MWLWFFVPRRRGRADQHGITVWLRPIPWTEVAAVEPDNTLAPERVVLELVSARRKPTSASWREHGEALRALHATARERS